MSADHDPVAAVAAEIRAELARQHITHDQLAERLGVSQAWVSRRLSGQTAIQVGDLAQIANALRCPVHQFMRVLDDTTP